MARNKPGDHPITDILDRREVYGAEADDLIRKIADLSSRRELDEWWDRELGWNVEKAIALERSRTRYNELVKRARDSGWEIDR